MPTACELTGPRPPVAVWRVGGGCGYGGSSRCPPSSSRHHSTVWVCTSRATWGSSVASMSSSAASARASSGRRPASAPCRPSSRSRFAARRTTSWALRVWQWPPLLGHVRDPFRPQGRLREEVAKFIQPSQRLPGTPTAVAGRGRGRAVMGGGASIRGRCCRRVGVGSLVAGCPRRRRGCACRSCRGHIPRCRCRRCT
jgi:hypothetical protein